MKTLGSQEDIEKSRKAAESAPSYFLKIPETKTPWILLDLAYQDGFVHWVDVGGRAQRVVCAGGPEGKGFDTDNCPLCALTLEMYQEAKDLRDEGQEAKADRIKNKANRLHGKYEAQFLALRGQRIIVKTTKGKRWEPDFDLESDDEDSTVEAGVLSLTENMYKGLTGMIKGEGTEFIQSGTDLGNRILWSSKERKAKKRFKEVTWNAEAKEIDIPEVELPEDVDIESAFEIDTDEIDRVYSLLTGESSEEVGEDEEVDMEEDSEEEPDDADLDDDEEEEDEDEEILDDVDEDEEEDDFEDDLPWEDEEEEAMEAEAVEKSKAKTSGRARSKTTKTSTKAKGSSRKAGAKAPPRSRASGSRKTKSSTGKTRSSAAKSRSKSGSAARKRTTTKKKTSGKARM